MTVGSITDVHRRAESVRLKRRAPEPLIDLASLVDRKFQVLKGLLDQSALHNLLNGSVSWIKVASSRRQIEKVWPGCVNLTADDVKYMASVKLPDGRIDISLPKELGRAIIPLDEEALLACLPSGFRVAHYNLLMNPTNPNTQNWHQDHGGVDADDYYTLLIPLNEADGMGKTEVMTPYSRKFSPKAKIETPNVKAGDGLLFSGCLWHRGTPNHSTLTRYCVYMILTRAPDDKLFEGWK